VIICLIPACPVLHQQSRNLLRFQVKNLYPTNLSCNSKFNNAKHSMWQNIRKSRQELGEQWKTHYKLKSNGLRNRSWMKYWVDAMTSQARWKEKKLQKLEFKTNPRIKLMGMSPWQKISWIQCSNGKNLWQNSWLPKWGQFSLNQKSKRILQSECLNPH
jgi:hypothetical protein